MQYVVYVQVISRAGVSAHTIELHLLVDLGMESSHGARNRLHLSGSSPQNARMCSRHPGSQQNWTLSRDKSEKRIRSSPWHLVVVEKCSEFQMSTHVLTQSF